ncbi:hypothetical protein C427_5018 [Paraglaciecola psychrophila 170]|uniref:Uncharacterized protein n=1 Tax=Paraglaciecola psychrophila 170 TaxID=1129794 RepID=K7AAN5_9ALTE|nr:hypothetical protein C427_5018 [Paraglaciecola psychrophila 170]GAC39322.1 hypothetical protein GPSY_3711 [Paraglaciecola psychrophila 170]
MIAASLGETGNTLKGFILVPSVFPVGINPIAVFVAAPTIRIT